MRASFSFSVLNGLVTISLSRALRAGETLTIDDLTVMHKADTYFVKKGKTHPENPGRSKKKRRK